MSAEGDGGVLVDDGAVVAEAHGGDGRGVDDPGDVELAGETEELAGAVDIRLVHVGGIGDPEAVVGGDVDEGVAAFEGGGEGLRVAKIAVDLLGVGRELGEDGGVGGGAGEEAELRALGGVGVGYV